MNTALILIWGGILAFAVLMYVLLDGFDLGIGILFPWIPDRENRAIMMNSVAPVWDGNETWLVFGAAALYSAFPIAYSTLLPILYLPIMTMLGALIFRGVAFEFRFKAVRSRLLWDVAFSLGSITAAFCQGLILGTFIHGYTSPNGEHIGQYYVWFSPFSVVTGLAVVAGYALLGANWLIMKTEGPLQDYMFHIAKIYLIAVGFFIALVSLWTPFIDPEILHRWFSLPNFFYLLPLPLLTAAAWLYCLYALYRREEKSPFIMSVLLFWFCYVGLAISAWPYLVPRSITIWQAASNSKALLFTLVGALILIPLLLAYSIYAYRVFKGKVKYGEGYE